MPHRLKKETSFHGRQGAVHRPFNYLLFVRGGRFVGQHLLVMVHGHDPTSRASSPAYLHNAQKEGARCAWSDVVLHGYPVSVFGLHQVEKVSGKTGSIYYPRQTRACIFAHDVSHLGENS